MPKKRRKATLASASDAMDMALVDSLVNEITSMGTARDPSTYNRRQMAVLDRGTLNITFRSDWISRKVVVAPAEDATREWRSWQADKAVITKLEDTEKQLGIQAKVKWALIKARLFGGAGIVLGIDDGQTSDKPLNLDKVTTDGFKFAHVMTKFELTADQIIYDPMDPWYGYPSSYRVSAQVVRSNNKNAELLGETIHPSRVVRFLGNELPDRAMIGDNWGGDSVLQVVDDAVRATTLVTQGIAGLVHDMKIDVINVPGYTKGMRDKVYRANLLKRLMQANLNKSMFNALVVDGDEKWQRILTSFAQLPEVMRIYLAIASGASDIPMSRLLGEIPKGLNAGTKGESDIVNYYDRISTEQKTVIGPEMTTMDEVIVRSANGKPDPKITYAWNELWQLDEVQKSTVQLNKATATATLASTGLVSDDVLRDGLVNQLIEDDTYAGLEQAIEDNGGTAEPDDPVVAPGALDPVTGKPIDPKTGLPAIAPPAKQKMLPAPTQDAQPRTLYVYRKVINGGDIISWAKKQKFPNIVKAGELHVTVCWSSTPVDWMKTGSDYPFGADKGGNVTIPPGGARMVDKFGNCLVLLFNSSSLSWRHCDFVRAGASWDYPDYQPHVTITTDPGTFDWSKVKAYQGEIVLGPEIYETVDGNWDDDDDTASRGDRIEPE